MSLASRILDLSTAMATALNARVPRVGASAYDVAVLNGYTGTQAQFTADMTDPGNTDYAAQFNAQRAAAGTAGAATEAKVGYTQLSTQAEVFAGTVATKAVSPLQLAAYTQYASGVRVNGIQGLVTLMQNATLRPPAGTIIHVATENAYFGITSFGSVWRMGPDNRAEPLPAVPILLLDNASMTNLQYNYSNASGALWNRYLNFNHRNTAVNLYNDAIRKQDFRWDNVNNVFRLWPSASTYSRITYSGGTDQVSTNNGYTIFSFDTVEFDGLYADYLGTTNSTLRSSYKLNYAGHYDLSWHFAMTNTDTNDYAATFYNEVRNLDNYTLFKGGTLADFGMTAVASRYFNAADTIRCALYKAGTNSNWVRRGNADQNVFTSNRPTLTIRYLGWD